MAQFKLRQKPRSMFPVLILMVVGFLSLFYIFYRLVLENDKEPQKDQKTSGSTIKEALANAKSIADLVIVKPEEIGKNGVIVCAGGFRAIECFGGLSWMRDLEKTNPSLPKLPIEWFYAGDEMSEKMMEFLKPKLDPIKFVDCLKISNESVKVLRGYPIKAFAAVYTSFEKFVFLDSDCIPLKHPGFIFENANFKEKGTMFWRDFRHRGNFAKLYQKYHDGFNNKLMKSAEFLKMPENESGQFAINRKMHIDVLKFVWGLNKMKDVFYKIVFGDKDLFALGFYLLDKFQYYYQVPLFPYTIRNSLSRHEAIGQRNPENPKEIIFVHRTHQKQNCLNKIGRYCVMPAKDYSTYSEEEPLYTRYIYKTYQGNDPVPENLKKMVIFVENSETMAAEKLLSLSTTPLSTTPLSTTSLSTTSLSTTPLSTTSSFP